MDDRFRITLLIDGKMYRFNGEWTLQPNGMELFRRVAGLKDEIEKIDRLLDYDFLRVEILVTAIAYSLDRRHITDLEAEVLRRGSGKAEKPVRDRLLFFVYNRQKGKTSRVNQRFLREFEFKVFRPYRRTNGSATTNSPSMYCPSQQG